MNAKPTPKIRRKVYAELAVPKEEPGQNKAKIRFAVGDSVTQGYVERHTDKMYANFEALVQAVKLDIKTTPEVSDLRSEIDDIMEEAHAKVIDVLVREGIIERPTLPHYD
ncbi:hypothetical protein Aura_00024 [Pseudomonas phage vB_PpuM-Aura]